MAGTILMEDVYKLEHSHVSMESGLDGRNNAPRPGSHQSDREVSMESGLDGRNNPWPTPPYHPPRRSLNGVRPRWPEQCGCGFVSGAPKS